MIDLKSAAHSTRPRTKRIELPEITPTKTQADELAAIYMRVVRVWRDAGERIVAGYDPPPISSVRDGVTETEAELAAAQTVANTVIVTLTADLEGWINRLARWHRNRWSDNVRSKTGVSIADFLTNAAVEAELRASLAWNVSLIRNVSDQARDRISNIVWAGWRNGAPRKEIAKQINEAVGLGVKRSRRIAIDQATKLSSDLDRARMLEAGIQDWTWIHSRKQNPRHDHVIRNGKEYNWITNRPPDLPGQLPFCGCKSRALLKLD